VTGDPIEAIELERAADWRIKKLGEDPSDRQTEVDPGFRTIG